MFSIRYLLWLLSARIATAALSLDTAPLITASPALIHRQNEPGEDSPSCAGFYSLVNSCAATTPGFIDLALTAQLDCVCSTSSTRADAVYDGYWSSCLAYISTASPAVWEQIQGAKITVNNPCEAFGPSATRAVGNCEQWLSTAASCAVATPSLTALPLSSQASCLCYSASMWIPSAMDRNWAACLSVYKTMSPSFFSSISGYQGNPSPCALAGNVRSAPTATSTPASASDAAHTTPLITSEPSQMGATPNRATTAAERAMDGTVLFAIGLVLFLI